MRVSLDDSRIILENRLRQIGREDLANWIARQRRLDSIELSYVNLHDSDYEDENEDNDYIVERSVPNSRFFFVEYLFFFFCQLEFDTLFLKNSDFIL